MNSNRLTVLLGLLINHSDCTMETEYPCLLLGAVNEGPGSRPKSGSRLGGSDLEVAKSQCLLAENSNDL